MRAREAEDEVHHGGRIVEAMGGGDESHQRAGRGRSDLPALGLRNVESFNRNAFFNGNISEPAGYVAGVAGTGEVIEVKMVCHVG